MLQSTDEVAWSVYVFECLLVTFVNLAKTAEPVKMLNGKVDLVGPRNHVLHGGADPQEERAILGVFRLIEKHYE